MTQGGVDFGILGPFEMCIDGTSVPLGTPKQRAVLATLVVHRNRVVGIDDLISAAWDMEPPEGARATLHTYVSNLRRLMNVPGIDTRTVLAAVSPGYRLCVPDSSCDVGRFVAERAAGLQAASDACFEEASRHFSSALAQWRGPVLDDLRKFTIFHAFAAALAEDQVATQLAYAEAEIACGRPSGVIGDLEALTTEHPYREALWAQLITAYYLAQRQADALNAYQRLRSALVEDLGVEPGAPMRALHGKILRQESLDVAQAARHNAGRTITLYLKPLTTATEQNANGPVLRGDDGRKHPLHNLSLRIGRSPDNHVVVTDGRVSRHHAAIIDTGSNFVIADLQSKNGVFVRGRRIHASAILSNGDRIRIGDHKFVFEAVTQPLAGD